MRNVRSFKAHRRLDVQESKSWERKLKCYLVLKTHQGPFMFMSEKFCCVSSSLHVNFLTFLNLLEQRYTVFPS